MMGVLIGAYIFGSVGRGEQDAKSDLDILAVVENQKGKVSDKLILELLPENLCDLKPSIAWYGQQRLREMFGNGELFAWHLYYESFAIGDDSGFLSSLGVPHPYGDSQADFCSFAKVMDGIPAQLAGSGFNAVYEAGLMYVCLRNMAMSASAVLNGRPDFSRYSPFAMQGVPPCPISLEVYDIIMSCRLSGQRGLPPPRSVDADFIFSAYNDLVPWLRMLRDALEGKLHG